MKSASPPIDTNTMQREVEATECGSDIHYNLPDDIDKDRPDLHVMHSSLTTTNEFRSVMNFISASREKTSTPLLDVLLLSLNKCSDVDFSMIRQWETFKSHCKRIITIYQYILKRRRFDRTVLSTEDQLSFIVLHRNPVELLPERIKSVSSYGIVSSIDKHAPETSLALHMKDGQTNQRFAMNLVQ